MRSDIRLASIVLWLAILIGLQISRLGGEFFWEVCVDVWVVLQVASGWVVGYVGELILEVGGVADSVFVIAGVPDFSLKLHMECVGVAAFDALDATLDGLAFHGCYEDVYVFGHDGEAV